MGKPAPPYLFVYGSLREGGGAPDPVWKAFKQGGELIGAAYLPGTLCIAGRYFAAVEGGSGRITGEVVRLKPGSGTRLFAVLDEYEGAVYRRVVRRVVLDDGGALDAWVYLWSGETVDLKPIKSGDWLKERAAR